ncbi:MAG: hypothetical protein NTZ17_12445 [Phycisphaerae bacterium]|nr:hypothetical protein [Phycisphaerae bacterium]
MRITVTNDEKIAVGQVLYVPEDYAFQFRPKPAGVVTSLLVNDVELEIDGNGHLLNPWGYCPYMGWIATDSGPDHLLTLRLKVEGLNIVPGISMRVNEDSWGVWVNRQTRWTCIGNAEKLDTVTYVEFATDSVVALSSEGEIRALWLRPVSLPAGNGIMGASRVS